MSLIKKYLDLPWTVRALVGTAVGAGVGRGLTQPQVTTLLARILPAGIRNQILPAILTASPEEWKQLQRFAMALGGLGGAYFGGGHELVHRPGGWTRTIKNLEKSLSRPHIVYRKRGSDPFLPDMDTPSIGLGFAKHVVQNDPYLREDDVGKVVAIIDQAGGGKSYGVVAPKDLVRGALSLGVRSVPAYMFGAGVGKLLGLDQSTVKKLSWAGGIASAIVQSGVLGDIPERIGQMMVQKQAGFGSGAAQNTGGAAAALAATGTQLLGLALLLAPVAAGYFAGMTAAGITAPTAKDIDLLQRDVVRQANRELTAALARRGLLLKKGQIARAKQLENARNVREIRIG